MDKYKIHLYDLNRILQGQVPMSFYIEIIIRAVVLYLVVMIALRLMAKRMTLNLNRTELGALSTVAAAIGVPLQSPDRGLLPPIIIVGIVILMQRWINYRSAKSEKFERLVLGKITTLVQDGRLQPKEMKKVRISRERVFAELRVNELTNLGEVQRMYIEANGSFTLIKSPQPQPGLCIIPEWDTDFTNEKQKHNDLRVCGYCGSSKAPHMQQCPNCDHHNWVAAVGN
jgi:Predicted membrane protein